MPTQRYPPDRRIASAARSTFILRSSAESRMPLIRLGVAARSFGCSSAVVISTARRFGVPRPFVSYELSGLTAHKISIRFEQWEISFFDNFQMMNLMPDDGKPHRQNRNFILPVNGFAAQHVAVNTIEIIYLFDK